MFIHVWTIVVGILCALPCALLGNFLVLRRMSMMGDAITHAVLPGIGIAFLISESRAGPAMFLGAIVAGLLTTLFTQWVQNFGKVDRGAAMGVVFTTLFALGLILIRQTADRVHLDVDCVLYGAIETTPQDTVFLGAFEIPRAALTLGGVLLLDALVVGLLYKEFKISSFDPALATTLGIHANVMHYLLMVLVAITTVAAFEAIGSILVVAMLIVPAAAAHLLTDRLGSMIAVSLVLAALSAVLGHGMAMTVPGWFGLEGSASTAGSMTVALAGLFALTWLAAPQHGLISRSLHRRTLRLRIEREDVLGLLYRAEELNVAPTVALEGVLIEDPDARPGVQRRALQALHRDGLLRWNASGPALTEAGREAARHLVRAHRLWETYLHRFLNLPTDHLHAPAHHLEHVTDEAMRRRLEARVENPEHDPQGRRIPGETASD